MQLLSADYEADESPKVQSSDINGDDAELAELDRTPAHQGPADVDLATFSAWFLSFPPTLTKGLEASLVFAEILGVLKGSEATLLCENVSLSLRIWEAG